MARLAVVSDVHGNLAALRAVVDDLRARPVDEVLLGGDLVQGGRQPAETPDLIAQPGWAGASVLAYGHIHHAYRRRLPEGLLASVGAVSLSNDRDPRPAYSVFDLGAEVRVEVRRVAYDAAA